MINVGRVIRSKAFHEPILIERTTGGHYEKSHYVPSTTRFTVMGVVTSPKGTASQGQTDEGSRATGYINVRTPPDAPLYITSDTANGNDISDTILRDSGLKNEDGSPIYDRYKIFNINDYSRYGYWGAEAVREGAI